MKKVLKYLIDYQRSFNNRHDVSDEDKNEVCGGIQDAFEDLLAMQRKLKAFENTKEKIEVIIKEIDGDTRLSYPAASVLVNAPLALIQCSLKSQRDAYQNTLCIFSELQDEQ